MRPPTLALSIALAVPTVAGTVGCSSTERPDGGSGLLHEGASVPPLQATAHDGSQIDLARGEETRVVYFYPKDATPGCTKEACAFRDAWERYRTAGISVIGVSADSLESHRIFADEHRLPFPLVSDEDGRWAQAFGVPTTMGMTKRVTFLLHAGKVAKRYPDVDPALHADEVLRDAQALAR